MVSWNSECRALHQRGFSLIEMVVVLAIIGILSGLGAVSYTQFINRQRLTTAADIVASNLRQARQLAIATRISHRVVFSVPKSDPQLGDLPQEVWIERLDDLQSPKAGQQDSWVQVTDPKRLPAGAGINSFSGRKTADTGTSPLFYAEYNFRGQMTKSYFANDRNPTSMSLYVHLARAGDTADPAAEDNRSLVHSVEVLRLTGRVRTYDYGYGQPFPTTEQRG